MNFVPLSTEAQWHWFNKRTHVLLCEDMQGIVALSNDGEIGGICVFDTWTPDSVNVHMAIDDPFVIRKGFFTEIANHAFNTGGKKRMFGLVPSNNPKALKLDKHIGFTEVARIPDAVADGVDYIVMRLDKENCRFLPSNTREVA